MRGRAPSLAVLGACIGITPAYAGKSRFRDSQPCRRRDHPRVCGEEIDRQGHHADDWGSPPRMRGRATAQRTERTPAGITPAYAGKRPAAWAGAWRTGDHPRVCGEELQQHGPGWWPWGSPPRMRGRGLLLCCVPVFWRITPAYAGKSAAALHCADLTWDHPRVCGEKPSSNCCLLITSGSPPRMRGKGQFDTGVMGRVGITPAYAGKSCTVSVSQLASWDHPRVCGEKRISKPCLF